MSILFLVVLGILAFFGVRGYLRGLLGMVFTVAALIFSIIFVRLEQPSVYLYLVEKTSWQESISQAAADRVMDEMADVAKIDDLEDEDLTEWNLPTYIQAALGEIIESVEKAYKEKANELAESANEKLDEVKQNIADKVGDQVARHAMYILSYVVTALLALIIVAVASLILKVILQHRGIRHASKVSGFVLGLVEGLIIAELLLYGISAIAALPVGEDFVAEIQSNALLTYMYNHNFVGTFLESTLMQTDGSL